MKKRPTDGLPAPLARYSGLAVHNGAWRRLGGIAAVVCPATGTSVLEAWAAEQPRLAALPILPEPFDAFVTRREPTRLPGPGAASLRGTVQVPKTSAASGIVTGTRRGCAGRG